MSRDTSTPARGQNTPTPPRGRPSTAVFSVAVTLILMFILVGALLPDRLGEVSNIALGFVTSTTGWSMLLIPLALIVLLFVLAVTRFGRIRLGPDGSRPDYPTYAWIAMLLGAVMGIGLITYGVAQPISHLFTPPHGLSEPGTQTAVVDALRFTFLDWGIHAWAVFALFGLAIGYSTYRLGNKGLVSAALRPLLGRHADGAAGKAIDVLVIIATLFGTTTSLGLGAAQISQGLTLITGVDITSTTSQIVIIAIVTVVFTASAVSGISRGIRYLSEITMVIAGALLIFVFIAGPGTYLIHMFLRSIGSYISDFTALSMMMPATETDLEWMQWWTYFMMAWWISWGAFVGIFLARISRGRTIRQFVFVVLGVPALVFAGWFTVFGGSAMYMDINEGTAIGEAAAENVNLAFFTLLDQLPLTQITSVVAVVLVVLYFVTGADSNTYVLSVISSDGTMQPRRKVLLVWGVLTGAVAAVLLYSGGLQALQTTVILTAAPFIFVILALAVATVIQLRRDPLIEALSTSTREVAMVQQAQHTAAEISPPSEGDQGGEQPDRR
ncbi:BCCT family transporter [Nesterenkonia sp. K-15-9-6]|uniref:BCCT family transporter n=1 Tax=Nesterenkonia sp. K-15-9-6 TaxID=3093918 RepID=UPI004044D3AF